MVKEPEFIRVGDERYAKVGHIITGFMIGVIVGLIFGCSLGFRMVV